MYLGAATGPHVPDLGKKACRERHSLSRTDIPDTERYFRAGKTALNSLKKQMQKQDTTPRPENRCKPPGKTGSAPEGMGRRGRREAGKALSLKRENNAGTPRDVPGRAARPWKKVRAVAFLEKYVILCFFIKKTPGISKPNMLIIKAFAAKKAGRKLPENRAAKPG